MIGYFSEEKISDRPSDQSLLDIPVTIDGVVAFASKIFVDILNGVLADCCPLL